MLRRILRGTTSKGEINLPAVPGMVDEYLDICRGLFTSLGVAFNQDELEQLRSALEGQLGEAFGKSPRSRIIISYEKKGVAVDYHILPTWFTLEQAYDNWTSTRTPPFFGTEPDARVWTLAGLAADPAQCPVLDIGAGTGRNSLALARRGHPVDAVELSPKFAEILEGDARRESLNVRVLQRDVFEAADDLRTDYQLILLSEVVSDFRETAQLREVFDLAARCLGPGGHLVFNVFLARSGYRPDAAAREHAQQCYASIFTRGEVADAVAGLPLQLVSDDSVHDYEKAYLPADKWPPTSWYSEWVGGLDVFDLPRENCPIEMRWLVYGKAK